MWRICNIFNLTTVKHQHFIEVTSEKEISQRDFIIFDATGWSIDTVQSAKHLTSAMGNIMFSLLNKLIATKQSNAQKNICKQTKAWVYKKTVEHPRLVEKYMKHLVKKQKHTQIAQLPLAYKEVLTDLRIVSILHDIGRLSEIDLASGTVCMKRSGVKKNHSLIGYEILAHATIKTEIILAIKHHESAGLTQLRNDKVYQNLTPDQQKLADYYTLALQDMDKTANLDERSRSGILKCAEFFDPCYLQDYTFTPQHLQNALDGQYLNLKGGHLLDAMASFVTWTYSIHFAETKTILQNILKKFFKQMYLEAKREYKVAPIKEPARLATTLSDIKALEEYALKRN